MPHWLGFDKGAGWWYGSEAEPKHIGVSVEPSGLQFFARLPSEEWQSWIELFKQKANDVLGYKIGEPENGYEFKYYSQAKKISNDKNIYHILPEIAKIINNGNEEIYENFKLLVENVDEFCEKYQEFSQGFSDDYDHLKLSQQEKMRLIFADWLTGRGTTFTYGAYVDLSEEINEIIVLLERVVEKLGFPLNLADVHSDYVEDMLVEIDDQFQKKGYRLFCLDTGGDDIYLFVATIDNFEKLKVMGKSIGFQFFTWVSSQAGSIKKIPHQHTQSIMGKQKKKMPAQIQAIILFFIILAGLVLILSIFTQIVH